MALQNSTRIYIILAINNNVQIWHAISTHFVPHNTKTEAKQFRAWRELEKVSNENKNDVVPENTHTPPPLPMKGIKNSTGVGALEAQ